MGFVFAAVFLWLAKPGARSMLVSVALVAAGLWLRGYAAGYVKKNMELTTTGPYAYTRNPLYLGSMLIDFGFSAAAASWIIFTALAVLFAAIYWPTIQSEEAWLRGRFAGFEDYARRVPRLLPRLTPARLIEEGSRVAETGRFSWALYRKHREYNALMGAAAIYVALALKLAVLQR
jgi:protein-S-isoprenylcysteine O-methyltransferase Ste14